MICADSFTWINFIALRLSEAAVKLEDGLSRNAIVMAPPVLTELLAFPGVRDARHVDVFLNLQRLAISDGYWERAGDMRRHLLQKSLKARAMDALIAQSCIDNDAILLTDDNDFRQFAPFGLRLG